MQSKMQRWTSVRNKDSMSPYGGEGEQDSPPEEVSYHRVYLQTYKAVIVV